ncbi:MAG: hypothetical protein KAY32_06500 [Candidatus Eisenbacteria sp.]|nr:hypothetical protein [Candidatus Eisenbacteria bacterium]
MSKRAGDKRARGDHRDKAAKRSPSGPRRAGLGQPVGETSGQRDRGLFRGSVREPRWNLRFDTTCLWSGVVIAALFLALVVCIVPVRYEANDDFAIVRQLSPASRLPTDSHVHLMGWGIAHALHHLYARAPQIPWFGVTLFGALWLSYGLLGGVLLRLRRTARWGLGVAAIALIVCLGECAVLMSFTSAALLLLFSVFLALTEWAIRGGCPVRERRLYVVFLALAFVLGFSLRWQLALAVLPVAAPILLFVRREQLRRALVVVLPIVMIVAADQAIHHLSGGDEHRRYAEFNLLRARFHDTANGDYHGKITEEAAAAVGWVAADYSAFHRWVVFDDQLFNTETLRTFLEINRPDKTTRLPQFIVASISENLGRFWAVSLLFLLAMGALVLSSWHCWRAGSRGDRWRRVVILIMILGAVLVLLAYRYVPRVFIPLFVYGLGLAGLMAALVSKDDPVESAWRSVSGWRVAILAILAGGTIATGYLHGKFVVDLAWMSREYRSHIQSALRDTERRLGALDPLLVMMNASGGLMLDAIHPLKEYSGLADLRISPGGTSVNSPRYNELLSQLGLSSGRAFLAWLIDNPGVLLVLDARGEENSFHWEHLWLSYFKRNVAPEAQLQLVPVFDYRADAGYGLVFYQLRRAGRSAPTTGPSPALREK